MAAVCCSDDIRNTWSRTDGGSIPSEARIERKDYNVHLRISQLKRTDEGDYSCMGTNIAGSTTFPLQLLVHGSLLTAWLPACLCCF